MKRARPLAVMTIALSAVLAGCADSSSTTQFDQLFNVTNKTTSNFANATIVDAETGSAYYSGALLCGAGQASCPIYYSGPAIGAPVDFIFHDDRGMVVAAYKLGTAPDAFTGLEVSARTTGYYLIDQLLRGSAEIAAMPQSQREALAYAFTQNYISADGATDYHEEMAAHYAYRARSNGLTVAKFLDDLAGRLLGGEVAGAEEFSQPSMALVSAGSGAEAAAQAVDDSCSSATSNFLTISGAVAFGVQNAFPIAGTVMSAAVGLAQSACDDTSTKLDVIDSKLNQLQLSLDSLSDGLGELRSFTAGAAINAGEDAFQTLSRNVERLASTYRAMKANRNVGSLRDYVRAVGGTRGNALRRALDSEINGGPLTTLLQNFKPAGLQGDGSIDLVGGDVLIQFERLMQGPQIDTIVRAVKLQCDNPPAGANNDIIAMRVQCNLFLATSVARLVAAHQLANELAAQVYEVFDAYRASDADTVAQFDYLLSLRADDYKAALKARFQRQQDGLVAKYKSDINGNPVAEQTGMYDTFRGLDVTLRNRVAGANCYNDSLKIPSIVGWVKTATDEYLKTQCKDFASPILARYYLTLNRNSVNSRTDICNVLGVLTPCSRLNVQERPVDRSVATDYRSQVPLAIRRLNGGTPFVGYFTHNPNYRRDLERSSISARPLPTTGTGLRGLQNVRVDTDRGVANLASISPVQYLVWGDTPYFTTWLRHTQSNYMSVVFALQGINFALANAGENRIQMVCVTADCSVVEGLNGSTPGASRGLSFIDGLSNLTIGDYGARISASDFGGSRDLYGFFVKRDGQYVPIYER